MKKLAIVLGVIAIIGVAGYQYRLQLLMTAVPIIAAINNPIAPNRIDP